MRLPLYAKILLWFFLNLVLLAAVFALLFNAQFSFNLDWFMTSGARERLEALRDLVIGELDVTPPDEWQDAIRRYSEAHHVRLALFDDLGNPLVSDIGALPDEVQRRIAGWSDFGRRRRGPEIVGESASPTVEPSGALPPQPGMERERRPRRGPPLRTLIRTSNPTQYWLLASGRIDNWLAGDPMRVVLVVKSNSITAGGLIFDPRPWMVLGCGAVLFSLLFWFPLVHGITRSVGKMRAATRQIADGRFEVRVNMRRRDELGALGESIDQMAARLDGLVQGQKRFLGDVAHELCSPLARLQIALGILEQRVDDEQSPYVRAAHKKAEEISGLVSELLSFSKASFGAAAVKLLPVNVRELVDEALRREEVDTAKAEVHIPPDLCVTADHDLLLRAVTNILRNAQRAAAPAGRIVVTSRIDGNEAIIAVEDSGPGVPEAELSKIFDAFYRIDPSRDRTTGGAGLGLAIVKTCVESCGGFVAARNRTPHGLEVSIRLPAAAAPLATGGERESCANADAST